MYDFGNVHRLHHRSRATQGNALWRIACIVGNGQASRVVSLAWWGEGDGDVARVGWLKGCGTGVGLAESSWVSASNRYADGGERKCSAVGESDADRLAGYGDAGHGKYNGCRL